MKTGNVLIGAIKPTTTQKKQQLKIFNTRLDEYIKELEKLDAIFEKKGRRSDEEKIYLLEKKINALQDKIKVLENSIPKSK